MTENRINLSATAVSSYSFHVAITVPDLDEALRFYRDTVGFEQDWSLESDGEWIEALTEIPGVFVRTTQLRVPGGSRIELQEYTPGGDVGKIPMNDPGLTHIAFGVEDVQAEYERLSAAGVVFRGDIYAMDGDGVMSGYTVAYFEDPWGLTLELLGPTPGETPKSGEEPA